MEPANENGLENLNFELFHRKQMFKQGILDVPLCYENTKPGEQPDAKAVAKKIYKTSFDIPVVMPIQLKQDQADDEELKIQDVNQILVEANSKAETLNFDPLQSQDEKKKLLEKFDVVKTRQITYDLPLLIIYNPVSGKSVNMVPIIELKLTMKNIPFELKPTKKAFDTYYFAKEADLSKYSMIVAAGGDGSYHEVVNGMLARQDGKKLPVALIPNGSGNDTCRSLGFTTLAEALDNIINAEVVKVDTIRTLVDYDSFEDIPKNDDKIMLKHCRHMIINSGVACLANIVREAIKYKKCCGTKCYDIATLQEAVLGRMKQYQFTCEIDGKKVDDIQSILFIFANGKHNGGGMICDPFACMNDGLMDAFYVSEPKVQNLKGVADMLDKASKKGAIHIYDKTCTFIRCKKMVLNFKGIAGKKCPKNGWGTQSMAVDGELLDYKEKIVQEVCPDNVEFCFNSKKYHEDYKMFQ